MSDKKTIEGYLDKIEVPEQRSRMVEIFNWISETYPSLTSEIKWNQPMFIDHGTFIIGFSMAKHHMSFTPEEAVINIFSEDIEKAGYERTKGLAKIKWTDEVNYDLLAKMIDYNIETKKDCKTFFRK